MADGTLKPIDRVKVGDRVLTTDPLTGERRKRRVTHVWVHLDRLFLLDVAGQTIATTEDHPFWNDTDQEWQEARDLDPGERVLTASGRRLRVGGFRGGPGWTAPAYNLTVAEEHVYHAGGLKVLVHNTDPCESFEEGAASQYRDATRKSAVRNTVTEVTHHEFTANLTKAGWESQVSKDGRVRILANDGARYVLREGADSYDGWTADYYGSGAKGISKKIRLGYK